ncbi:MAG: hypothetical protein AAGA18_09935, partial [Verrucomicrobiota bacterium]
PNTYRAPRLSPFFDTWSEGPHDTDNTIHYDYLADTSLSHFTTKTAATLHLRAYAPSISCEIKKPNY